MTYITESTLSDSFIFNTFNNNSEMTRRIGELVKNGTIVNEDMVTEQILQIKRTRISPLADKVLDAFHDGKIILIYSNSIKLPQAIPFTIAKIQGLNRAFVFLNNFGTLVDSGIAGGGKLLNMNMKDLYVLMESAYIAYSYYEYPIKLIRNLGIMKFCSSVYTDMYMRILNKEYALSMEPDLYNRVAFVINRFFLDRVWENQNKDISITYAMNNILNPNKSDLIIINDSYEQANIKSIPELVTFLRSISPKLNNLNMRYLVECFMNTYKQGAVLSMDCLPYFLFTLICTFNGCFIINQPLIHSIIKETKGSNIFYSELSKVI